ncbi:MULTISPECIES: hypothetical protein [Enterobacter cloacae complex]|uniref:Uncharacterized protein n=1 Tax=Enterobacter hormaechei subsp. steigerwaltii TaxID=299766 RepID=A0AAE4ECG0_9ENTR|nr:MULTISPECIES: hypothetical protein [Enterobacter cloacae complex]EEL4846030.1 hypothetical protein [Salmonella enterica]ELT3428450.1 hypothetical protein [Shigella sonnei]EGA5321906.1 hypothetical protein [Salmonella enterica]EJD1261651.1 hypothetical protein [Salmonella enterica]EJN2727544.1 hypothetical protein [Salmonella enterica]
MKSNKLKKNNREVVRNSGDHFMVVGKTGQGKTSVLLEVMDKVLHLKENGKR